MRAVSSPRPGIRQRLTKVGAVVGLTALLGGCGFSLQTMPKLGGQSGPGYTLHAQFANVLNLPQEAQVRVGAAVVGHVASISTKDFRADVGMRIAKHVRIPVGTTAEVRFDSPLGDEYVELTVPTSITADLKPGAVLTESDTSTAPSIEDTLSALGTVLNGAGINQLQTIISELDQALGGNSPEVRQLLNQLVTLVSGLNAHKAQIDGALNGVDRLASQLAAGKQVIGNGIAEITPAVVELQKENSELANLLKQVSRLSVVSGAIIGKAGNATAADIKSLLPVVNQLVSVQNQIGPDLSDIAAFETATPKIAPGDYLQIGVTVNANLNQNPSSPDVNPSATGVSGGNAAASTLLEDSLP